MGKKSFKNTPIGGKAMKSRKLARKVTSKYHELNAKLKTSLTKEEKVAIKDEIKALGGIDKYQQASVISTQFFNTSKFIIKTLRQFINNNSVRTKTNVPNVLEVGAINTVLKKCTSFKVRAIDIHSQHTLIEELDFFDLPPERDYDAVVCSMVVNCVAEPERRGEMICRLVEQIHEGGIIFLVLPSRCIQSEYLGMDLFDSFLRGLGCIELQPKRITPHLIFYFLGKSSTTASSSSSSSASHGSSTVSSWPDSICATIHSLMDTQTLERLTPPQVEGTDSTTSISPSDTKKFRLYLPKAFVKYNAHGA